MNQKVTKYIRRIIRKLGFDIIKHKDCNSEHNFPKDFDRATIDIILKVKSLTMTSPERISALCEAVKYITINKIPGEIVECGVWRGGSMMAIALTLLELQDSRRNLYLFDTFDGMTEPSEKDISITGISAATMLKKSNKQDEKSVWCYASLDVVRNSINSTGYDRNKIHLIQGRVEDTIPEQAPNNISLLRLDTDWYESTRHEMTHLFPRLSPGGVIIIDDYGHWQGVRQAIDEYIQDNKIKILLNRIDYTGRIGVVAVN